MQPTPDTKDWTWTLSRRCDECGLSAGEIEVAELPDRIEAVAAEWVQILTSSPAVSARPFPDVWSPLEYGAHVRDVCRLSDARLALMLVEDYPTFAYWDQDETAIAENYLEADPDEVAAELVEAAESFIARLQPLSPAQLERRGRRSDGAEFTVTTFAQYFFHDIFHHLWDVTGQQEV
ncbi:MAG TPA: DinB family protein [Propionibacteriaceae bacterium]|nr:DinB family protein [Propionibacteriaceae bacterium]